MAGLLRPPTYTQVILKGTSAAGKQHYRIIIDHHEERQNRHTPDAELSHRHTWLPATEDGLRSAQQHLRDVLHRHSESPSYHGRSLLELFELDVATTPTELRRAHPTVSRNCQEGIFSIIKLFADLDPPRRLCDLSIAIKWYSQHEFEITGPVGLRIRFLVNTESDESFVTDEEASTARRAVSCFLKSFQLLQQDHQVAQTKFLATLPTELIRGIAKHLMPRLVFMTYHHNGLKHAFMEVRRCFQSERQGFFGQSSEGWCLSPFDGSEITIFRLNQRLRRIAFDLLRTNAAFYLDYGFFPTQPEGPYMKMLCKALETTAFINAPKLIYRIFLSDFIIKRHQHGQISGLDNVLLSLGCKCKLHSIWELLQLRSQRGDDFRWSMHVNLYSTEFLITFVIAEKKTMVEITVPPSESLLDVRTSSLTRWRNNFKFIMSDAIERSIQNWVEVSAESHKLFHLGRSGDS